MASEMLTIIFPISPPMVLSLQLFGFESPRSQDGIPGRSSRLEPKLLSPTAKVFWGKRVVILRVMILIKVSDKRNFFIF